METINSLTEEKLREVGISSEGFEKLKIAIENLKKEEIRGDEKIDRSQKS